MKRSKSGAQKRKEAATARDAVAKLPKMTDFFKITEQSRPGTSTERDEENYSVQEKDDYDDQHQSDCEFPENVSCDLPANTQPSISKICFNFTAVCFNFTKKTQSQYGSRLFELSSKDSFI